MSPSEILNLLWSHSEGEYVFMPLKRPSGQWQEGVAVRPADVIPQTLRTPEGDDLYFTPLLYTGRDQAAARRRRENVGRPGALFADVDGLLTMAQVPPPSIAVESSPGHVHLYWLLEEPYALEEWEPRAKGLTQAIGADPGGWDATQVLRIPGTLNHKFTPPHPVEAVTVLPEWVYDLEQFPVAQVIQAEESDVPDMPDIDLINRADVLRMWWPSLTLSLRYWLSMTPNDLRKLGRIDRSKVLWRLMHELFDLGAKPEAVFHLLRGQPYDKFAGHPEQLWVDITKAAAQR